MSQLPRRFNTILFLFIFSLCWTRTAKSTNLLPDLAPGTARACSLFSDGIQDEGSGARKVGGYSPVLLQCRPLSGGTDKIAIRRMTVSGSRYLLTVDPVSLLSRIEREACLSCAGVKPETVHETRYGSLLERLSHDYKPMRNKPYLVAAGLKRAENAAGGSIVTVDLCPSLKPMDRSVFLELERLQPAAPVAIAISGRWLERHAQDFAWLKKEAEDRRLAITWVNHSFHHGFRSADVGDDKNYLLSPGLNVDDEIFNTEKLMIERGITPSVFFRFPALISNLDLMKSLKGKMLLPLAADAWLAIGEKALDHSIILLHATGNEPRGLSKFKKLIQEKHLPLPLRPLLPVLAR